jgi:hypothetical protein
MSSKYFILIFFLLRLTDICAQDPVHNNAFRDGEFLKYRVYYTSSLGNFNAGEVEINVSEYQNNITDSSNSVYHIIGTGKTNSFFDMFYKVRDRFESQIDSETLLPNHFVRRTKEGNFEHDDDVFFDRKKNIAVSRRAKKEVPENIHDILSAVYFMRSLAVEDFGDDSTYHIDFYLDDSVYQSKVIFEGRVILETEMGWLPCLKIKPMMATGEVFSRKYPMSVWVTDDENHIPVMAGSEIIIGSVRMELIEYDGLKNPFIKPLTKKELKKYKKN